MNYNYFAEEFDRQRSREGIRLALRLAEHPEFAAILDERIDPLDADLKSDDALDEWLMREATTGQHISGTCKMGAGGRPNGGGGSAGAGIWRRGLARGGRLHYARLHPREHECDHHDDRRAGG